MTHVNERAPMDASSEAERAILARARAGFSPTPADAARVRHLLVGALAGGATATPAHTGASPAGARGWSWARRLLAGASIAAAAGAGGYGLGHRAGLRQGAASTAARVPQIVTVQVPERTAAEVPSVPSPTAISSPPRPATPAAAPSHKHPSAASAKTVPSLEEEVRALRAVERALREGSPGLALALLGELDRAVPDGHLMEERAATAAIARCSLGQAPFGVDLAETFDDQHPGSVYVKRVRQACGKPTAP